MKCDIAVIGAGSAGIAAAISAAKSGLKVVLVERYGFVGGLATSAMVGTICGLYFRTDMNSSESRYAVQGFAREFSEGIKQDSNTSSSTYAEGLHFLPYQINSFHQYSARLLHEVGVQLLLHTSLTKVFTANKKIVKLDLQSMESIFSLSPIAVIDCSGNAQVSMLANLNMIKQPHYQSASLVFQVMGIPQLEPRLLSLNLIRWVQHGIEKGDLDPDCDRISIIPGTVSKGMALFKLGLKEYIPLMLTENELIARSRSVEIIKYLSMIAPVFKELSITMMATQIGIRSGSRSQGLQMLEEEHVLACKKPDDGIAIGVWPIEYWGADRKPDMRYFKTEDFYLIPAGALISQHLHNLFFAGKTISATEHAIASARVIGTCLGTGYAAGMLAAEFVKQDSWLAAISKVRDMQVFADVI